MSPAQRRKNVRELRKKKKPSKRPNFFLIAFLLLLASLSVYFALGRKYFSRDLKNTMVVSEKNGDIVVSVFDSGTGEVTSLLIPANTELSVSRQLGLWKAKSIWQLGENEGYQGMLLQETIVKNFHLPATIWAGHDAYGFVSGNFLSLFKALFSPYQTNMNIADRMGIFLLAFGLRNGKHSVYDLSQLGILEDVKLLDGERGFILKKEIPVYILSSFSESLDGETAHLAIIHNATGQRKTAENIGELLEAMGAKVVSIKEGSREDVDCMVSGKNRDFVKKISQVYSCQIIEHGDSEFDIEIKIGNDFLKRF